MPHWPLWSRPITQAEEAILFLVGTPGAWIIFGVAAAAVLIRIRILPTLAGLLPALVAFIMTRESLLASGLWQSSNKAVEGVVDIQRLAVAEGCLTAFPYLTVLLLVLLAVLLFRLELRRWRRRAARKSEAGT